MPKPKTHTIELEILRNITDPAASETFIRRVNVFASTAEAAEETIMANEPAVLEKFGGFMIENTRDVTDEEIPQLVELIKEYDNDNCYHPKK